MSHLDDHTMRHTLQRRALDAIYRPNPPQYHAPPGHRQELYDWVAAHMGDAPITYLEFGVFSGASMIAIAQRFRNAETRFVGFDSFEGIPDKWLNKEQGTFSRDGLLPQVNDPRVSFVKGWFQNTVPPFLARANLDKDGRFLIHFDADLYSSTLFLLCMLWPAIESYHFIFDEFLFDEVVALHDFALAFPVEFTFLAACNAENGHPAQVFGKMKRVHFNRSA